MTVLNASSTSGNSMSPTGLTYDTGKTTHQAEISFDTENKTAAVTVDGAAGAASTGPLLSADYLNAFSFSAMDRMKIGSYLRIKKIKVQQTAQNDRVTAALSALEGLPATLAADPYAVAADLTLPEHEFITWTTSDSSVIDENGKVHRWFNDRDVVLTATYNDGGLCILKDYTMTVKALDGSSRQLLNETVTSDAGWAFENLLSSASGAYAVTPDGLEITKTTGAETETPAYEAKAYAADYRMFGLAEAYSSESAAVYSSGYCGVYDVSFQLKSQVAGNAPIYAEIGRQNGAAFSEALGLHVTKNGIDAVYISDQGEERTPVFSGSTYGKTFDVTLRIDTVRKQGWIFVDGSLATTALQLDSARDSYRIDTLRLALDLNNALYDSISVNHIRLEEWEYSEAPSKNALLSALDLLHIDDIVDNPDAVSTVRLPESANGTSLVWSCSSGLIDVDTGEVFHDESAADVVLCATVCSAESVYARKQFPLTVRQAESDEELIAYKLSQLGRSITAQNKEDLRYDLYLPTSYEGMQVQWTSSDETIIGANGAINRETAVTSPTAVSLTAQASLNGKSVQKTFDFVVSPYAYTYTIYSGASIPERFASDIKISRDTVTSLVFGANCTGRADIAFVDSSGKEAIKLVFDGNSYSFEYGGGATASYAAGGREAVDVMIMPDIDKVAVWRNGEILLDWCPAKDDIADFSGFSVSGDAVSMEQVTVKTDEYGVLDINKDHIDYFKPLEGNVLEGSVSLVTDTVLPAEVAWISSDPSVISSTGLVNTPSAYRFVNLSLQLTSLRDSSVLRTYSKTVAVACDSSRNIAAGAAAAVSTLEKDGFPITNLTDNDKTTVFGASGAGKQPEIELDFGTERHINSLYLNENFDSYDKGIESYELLLLRGRANVDGGQSGRGYGFAVQSYSVQYRLYTLLKIQNYGMCFQRGLYQ